jgi:hypothetical protein
MKGRADAALETGDFTTFPKSAWQCVNRPILLLIAFAN